MSRHLTKFLNTYWDASRWPVAITRKDPFGTRSLNKMTGEPPENKTMNKTEAVIARQILIYKADVPWVISLVVCSSVLPQSHNHGAGYLRLCEQFYAR
jgi:hypothetical protein